MSVVPTLTPQLKKAVQELEKMGVRVHIETLGDTGLIFIDMKSVGETVIKRVRVGCKSTFIEGNYLIIKVSVKCQESYVQSQ